MCKWLTSVGCRTGDVRGEKSGMGGESVDRGDMNHERK